MEKRPSSGDELKEDIVVSNVRREYDQTKLLRLQSDVPRESPITEP